MEAEAGGAEVAVPVEAADGEGVRDEGVLAAGMSRIRVRRRASSVSEVSPEMRSLLQTVTAARSEPVTP